MVGPLIYGFSEDAVAAAKVIADFAKGNDKLVIKGGAYAGKALDANGVKALAAIPSREVLIVAGGRPAEVADPAHGCRGGAVAAQRGGGGGRSGRGPAAAEACRRLMT
jgi:large subunit ribosomal protein L10